MAFEFKLPDIGEGTVEGEVVQWLVKEGDRVEPDQPVLEVMTDKATVELTAPVAGVVKELRAKPGDIVPVGEVLYVLETDGASPATEAPAASSAQDASPAAAAPAPAASAPAAPAAAAAPAPPPAAPAQPGKKPLATPATRKRARELGVDLATVQGTGPAGRI
ncbi:MAG: 2-oxo acid dehydrogenase subunit E2, partial [Planctomycetota bacterium]